MIELYFDGACRKTDIYASEGISGIGVHISGINTGQINIYENTGIKTSNQAEYLALIKGLVVLLQSDISSDIIHIYGDSLLVVNQVAETWQCKSPNLINYNKIAKNLVNTLRKRHVVIIKHVLRNYNRIADVLSNQGIDITKIDMTDAIMNDATRKN
jgi:ribonuclease HI